MSTGNTKEAINMTAVCVGERRHGLKGVGMIMVASSSKEKHERVIVVFVDKRKEVLEVSEAL